MKVTYNKNTGEIEIRLPAAKNLQEAPPSSTGKSFTIASTRGNIPAPGVVIDGKPLIVSVNAYVPAK